MEKPFPNITCAVCSKPYKNPRILSCLHSFCLQCLHHEIGKSGSQQKFQCPICERNTSIPVGGASGLPQNLHLEFEVEVAGYMSKMVNNSDVACDHCMDGGNGPAVVFCCTCHQFLCRMAYECHKTGRHLSKHNMVGLDQEGARQLHTIMKPRDHYCSQPNHGNNNLNLCCETCSLLVCRDCTTATHKSHTVKEISTVAKTHQIEITGALEDAREIMTKLTGAMDENNRMIEQVEISKRNASLAINKIFETLQQRLEERKKTLLSELEAISLSKTTALTLQKEQFEKMIGDIGHYTDMASQILQTHTNHEIVALGRLIPTELQATLKRVQTISLAPNQHSNITVSVQTDDLIRQLSKFGNVLDFYHSPSSSTWKSTSVAKVGTRYHVKIQSKTSKGAEGPHGGVEVKGEMRSKTHNGAVVYGEVEDHRDGTYTITLTPQTAGPHQLLITMDGQHIQNSPKDLDVRPKRDYRILCNAQQVIQCNGPRCVAIHDNGDIYVVSEDDCIYVFDQTGQLKKTIGSSGSGDGQFTYPSGLCIKGDVLYVADSGNHRVQKLTSGGKFLHKFGQQGSGQGQFNWPWSVIIDSNNKLIVSEYNNHRIQIFYEDGGWLLTIDGEGGVGCGEGSVGCGEGGAGCGEGGAGRGVGGAGCGEGVLDVAKVVLDVGKVVLDVAKVVLDVAKVVLDVAKVVLDVAKVVLDVAKVVLDVGKVVLDMGKVVLDMGKVVLDMGKVVLDMGKVVLDVGKVVLDGVQHCHHLRHLPITTAFYNPLYFHYFVSRDDVLHMLRCEHVQNWYTPFVLTMGASCKRHHLTELVKCYS
eukprot:Em0048g18a